MQMVWCLNSWLAVCYGHVGAKIQKMCIYIYMSILKEKMDIYIYIYVYMKIMNYYSN